MFPVYQDYYIITIMETPQTTSAYRLFSLIAIGFIGALWAALILTAGNAFFTPCIYIIFALVLASIAFISRRYIRAIGREYLLIALTSLLLTTTIGFFATPTIFSGRDQGSYSAAAIHLVQNHQLAFSTPASDAFFALHGQGRALNFPGFDYTEEGKLITQFPLGYIAWLASFFAIFGVSGFTIANTVTSTLFLIGLYLLLRVFVSRFYALWGFVIAATSLPVLWFSKFTLSENLALALFTLLSLHLVLFFKDRSVLSFGIALSSAAFLVFTRIEGIFFFLITCGLLLLSTKTREIWHSQKRTLLFFGIALFIISIRTFFLNFPFYKTIAKAALRKWQDFIEPCFSQCAPDASFSLWNTFFLYGFLPICGIGIISSIIIAKHKRRRIALIPLAIALPTFWYILSPSISIDHPWMLRRFVFSLYPALLFTAIIGIAAIQTFLSGRYAQHYLFKKHYYAMLLLLALLISQLPFALHYTAISEHPTLLRQTQTLAKKFTATDLVLIDRLSTGDAWSMLPEPLSALGITNAVYFFNPEDFATLDTTAFDHVYLIAPHAEIERYTKQSYKQLHPVDTFTIDTQKLNSISDNAFPQLVPITTPLTIMNVE